MQKLGTCWLEGTLSVANLEADTLPLVFSSPQDLDLYFNILATLGKRCVHRLKALKLCYIKAREQREAGHLAASSLSLLEGVEMRRGMFVPDDYQVSAASTHHIVCTLQYASFELSRGALDPTYRLLEIAGKSLKDNFTSAHPVLTLLLQHSWANYWRRRHKKSLVVRAAEACIKAWEALKGVEQDFSLYLTVRYMAALAEDEHYRAALGVAKNGVISIPSSAAGSTTQLDVPFSSCYVGRVTLYLLSEESSFTGSSSLGVRGTCQWLLTYTVSLAKAGLYRYQDAQASISLLTSHDVNEAWGEKSRNLRACIDDNVKGSKISKYCLPHEAMHHVVYRQVSKFVSKFAFGQDPNPLAEGMTPVEYVLANQKAKQQGPIVAPTTPVSTSSPTYLDVLLHEVSEEICEVERKETAATKTLLETRQRSLKIEMETAKKTAALLRSASESLQKGFVPAATLAGSRVSVRPATTPIPTPSPTLKGMSSPPPARPKEKTSEGYTLEGREKDLGVTLQIGFREDSENREEAMLNALYPGIYSTSRHRGGGLAISEHELHISASKQYNYVPSCKDLQKKQRILHTMLYNQNQNQYMKTSSFSYRSLQKELRENSAILERRRKKVKEVRSLQQKAQEGVTGDKDNPRNLTTDSAAGPATVFDVMKALYLMQFVIKDGKGMEAVRAPNAMKDVQPPSTMELV